MTTGGGCLFTATIHRKEIEDSEKLEIGSEKSSAKIASSPKSSPKTSLKTEDRIVELIEQDASVSTDRLGEILGISKRAVAKQIQKLKDRGRLRRIGPAKGGHWEVIE